uniref:Putative secreted protein n=1 Tax=Rhipicephalus microplus TaxID=6941 RepID=A0A6G5A239_RHIMP
MLYHFFLLAFVSELDTGRATILCNMTSRISLLLLVCFEYYPKTELNLSLLVQTYLKTKDKQCRIHHLFTSQVFFSLSQFNCCYVQLQSFVIYYL